MRIPSGLVKPTTEKFLNLYVDFGTKGGLSGILKQGSEMVSAEPGGASVYHVPVGDHLSVAGTPMTKGVVVALLDEVSTIGITIDDAKRRPGVSLTMDLRFAPDLEDRVRAGDTLKLISRTVKAGRNVAFCHMEAFCPQGTLLCSGSHSKFLPMGFGWEYTMHPAVQPLFVEFASRLGSPMDSVTSSLGSPDRMDDCFLLDSGVEQPPSVYPDGRFCNPIGAVHGGLMASVGIGAAEWAAGVAQLEALQVRFLAAGKPAGGLLQSHVAEVSRHGRAEEQHSKHYRGVVTQGGADRVCISFDARVAVA